MDANFELYKVFYYVARHLSFSEASKSLFISQSAVSQSISSLEGKLGSRLLFRNTKQVQLTQEGKMLFEYIEQAFNLIKKGESNIKDMQSLKSGSIRIGASDTICRYYLLPFLKRFNNLYPGIKIHVTNRTSPQCEELLRKGSVDFSIINIQEKYNYKDLEVTIVKKIQDVFIAGENYIHLKDKKISLKSLVGFPVMVLEKNSTTRQYFDELLDRNGVNLSPEIELESVDLLVELAKIGLGISYVMSDCIKKELDQGSIFILNIEENIPDRKLGIITQNNVPLSPAAKEMIHLLNCSFNA